MRGVAYASLGQSWRAIEEYDKAIQLDPDYVDAYAMRALTYVNLGLSKNARDDIAKACSLNSQYCVP